MSRLPYISRPCYDKWWRCPGWTGGGMRYAKKNRCNNGSVARIRFGFGHCDICNTLTLPTWIRNLDWRWWHSNFILWRRYR